MPRHIPTEETLLNTLGDTFKFLGALGRNASIATILRKEGLTEEVLDLGWSLLFAANGYKKNTTNAVPDAVENPTADALVQVDQADDFLFRRIKVVLQGDFPEQLDTLLEGGLSAKQGAESVGSLTEILNRLDKLEGAPNGKPVIEKLEARGVTAKERARLRALLTTATSPAPEVPAPPPPPDPAVRLKALVDSYYWYKEWAEIARDAIKRRDYLIALGLAEAKKPNKNK